MSRQLPDFPSFCETLGISVAGKLVEPFDLSTPFMAKAGRHDWYYICGDSHFHFAEELQQRCQNTALVLPQDGSGGRGPRTMPTEIGE
jgi:hypothetical protein